VILIDANILLYAHNSSSEHHSAAARWLEKAFSGDAPVCLTWMTILAFLRIATNSHIFPHPLSATQAAKIVSGWLEQPCVSVINPGERHWEILSKLLGTAQARGPLVMDTHLAALAIENGAVLYTSDQDFTRFPGLRTKNPLQR